MVGCSRPMDYNTTTSTTVSVSNNLRLYRKIGYEIDVMRWEEEEEEDGNDDDDDDGIGM